MRHLASFLNISLLGFSGWVCFHTGVEEKIEFVINKSSLAEKFSNSLPFYRLGVML